jgi:hypothetical protein
MAKYARPEFRVVLNNDEGVAAFAANLEASAEGLVPADSWDGLHQQVPGIIAHCVHVIQRELATGVDLWDLLEVLRRMTAPGDLGEFKESLNTSLPAVVEVVALIGTSPDSLETEVTDEAKQSGPSITTIMDAATQIVKTAQMVAIASSSDDHLGQVAELTGLLRTYEVSVRGRNYFSISRKVVSGIFEPTAIDALVRANVGFTPSDIAQLWESIQAERVETQESMQERMSELMAISSAGDDLSPEQISEGQELMKRLLLEPGNGISFSVNELQERSNLSASTIEAVLGEFSLETTGMTAVQACEKFVQGENLLAGKGLIRRDGRYLPIGDPLPHDYVRPVVETRLKAYPKPWIKYGKHRDLWTEETAGCLLAELLGVGEPTYKSLEYRAPGSETLSCDLSKESSDFRINTKVTEADALFIIDDVAICVEVKAGSITDKARSGNVKRVETDLRKTIGEASSQAARLESLISEQKGLWTPKGRWIDMSAVREVHTVVVCLDDWGPLAIAADALVKANVITSLSIPWLVSLHDLFAMASFMNSPSDFLTYLRRRTDPATSRLLSASDELDVVMWFMGGGMYFEPDPFAVHKKNPTTSRPRQAEREAFKLSNVPTQVGTHTDELDAWMYFTEGQTTIAAQRPIRKHQMRVASLIQHLEEVKGTGWLRMGADLSGLAEVAEDNITEHMNRLIQMTRADGHFHTSAMTFASLQGNSGLFIGTQPLGRSVDEYAEKIKKYAQMKKYQLHLDRALALLIDTTGRIVWSEYDSAARVHDPELEREIAQRRLLSPAQMRAGYSVAPRNPKPKKPKKRRR